MINIFTISLLLFKEIYPNQPFSLFKHVYLNTVEVTFQMLIARLKARGTILLDHLCFFWTFGRITNKSTLQKISLL